MKILLLDIETSQLQVKTWGIRKQYITPSQIVKDWQVIAVAAKWLNEPENTAIYKDLRKGITRNREKSLVKMMWKLMDEADIIIGQNSNKFDIKRLNAKFAEFDLPPPSPYRKLDTYVINKRHFGFTSHALDFLCNKLNLKRKKLKHKKYPGRDLWDECEAGNQDAWKEMEIYNLRDIFSLEDLYNRIKAWDATINFNVYHDNEENVCSCGSIKFIKKGFETTNTGRYQRYKCKGCGKAYRGAKNLLSKEKKASLLRPIK